MRKSMKRDVSLEEISDGNLYELNDMVKVGCKECEGCFACCQGMGNSIILDPFDIYQLTANLHKTFEELLLDKLELQVVDGIILPNLKMLPDTKKCVFLNEKGRCSIHSFRPGICRIFPLGRYYEGHTFHYFLQTYECKKTNRTKVKIRKWIDTDDIKSNQQFIIEWHYFLKEIEEIIKREEDEKIIKNINMKILNEFFIKNYAKEINFYKQFEDRLKESKSILIRQ